MELYLSGLASGFDWNSFVDQMVEAERAPQTTLRTEQSQIRARNNAYDLIKTQLTTLQSKAQALQEASLFDGRATTVSDSTVASASAGTGAVQGTFNFNILGLATAAVLQGSANIGKKIAETDITATSPDPDNSPTLADAGFATAVTGGTLTINGKQVTLETTDTLRQVFQKIKDATGVEASYDTDTDKITLSSASPIILGSPTDTSNFLQAARLNFNNTGTVTSATELGAVKQGAALASGNFTTAITDGGSGAGEFKINGVAISFNASADSLSNVISRINASSAGVIATYDSVNDRVLLSNKATGDSGIALEDVSGNFLAATGLTAGTLQRGENLTYTVNNSGVMTSASNTITEVSSGLSGLSVTALKTGAASVQVGSDNEHIKTAITDFVSAYNKVQSVIDTQTASSTNANGVVTAGTLAADREAYEIARTMRGLLNSPLSGLSGTISRLSQLGYASNSTDDTLTLEDSEALDDALANNLDGVKEFFTNATSGLATGLNTYLERTIGDEGTLVKHQTTLTEQAGDIDTQIADMERIVQTNREALINSFVQMEEVQSNLNQQLSYLQQQLASLS